MSRLLNIGAGPVPPPALYGEWEIVTLDIDESVNPDLCMDARNLTVLEAGQYDAVYASHVLEHFAEHEIDRVLWGFYHVLTLDGFADVRVPDARAVMTAVVKRDLDLNDVLYTAPVGDIRVGDVLWGWQKQVANSGETYYQHRWGFSRDTLGKALQVARFEYILMSSAGYGLRALAYKRKPEGAACQTT